MERYLVFDSECSLCSQLAETVHHIADNKLEIISIHHGRAKALLDRAYPQGWSPAPYLIVVEHNRVQAWTGFAAAMHLALILGPHRAWRIWNRARQHGVYLPSNSKASFSSKPGMSRRYFLKLSAGLTAAFTALGLLPSTAFACIPCSNCGLYCTVVSYCNYGGDCSAYGIAHTWYCTAYDCYDATYGDYCGRQFGDCCCTGTVWGQGSINCSCGTA